MTDVESAQQHIEMLVNKRELLIQRIDEAIGQFCLTLGRAGLTVGESLDVVDWARSLKIPHSTGRIQHACGHPQQAYWQYRRYGYAQHELKPGMKLTSATAEHAPGAGIHVVYGLLRGEQLVYVGVSQNFRERLKRHRKDKEFDGWVAEIQADRQSARRREADMISHYKPIYNVAGVWA